MLETGDTGGAANKPVLTLLTSGSSFFRWTSILGIGVWALLTFTMIPAIQINLYFNGQIDAARGGTFTAPNAGTDLTFGRGGDLVSLPTDGQIGPVLIHNRILSDAEILWLYNEPFAVLRGPDVYRR